MPTPQMSSVTKMSDKMAVSASVLYLETMTGKYNSPICCFQFVQLEFIHSERCLDNTTAIKDTLN